MGTAALAAGSCLTAGGQVRAQPCGWFAAAASVPHPQAHHTALGCVHGDGMLDLGR